MERIFKEAVDTFCAMHRDETRREKAANIVGTALDIPHDQVTHILQRDKPHVNQEDDRLVVGRASLDAISVSAGKMRDKQSFAYTRHVLCLMERLIVCVNMHEPILLVGETGTGKTTAVQQLAVLTNRKLIVVNMSQQNDSSDLLGGFKPVDVRLIAAPAMELFDSLFFKTFSRKRNQKLMNQIRVTYEKGKWSLFTKAIQSVLTKVEVRLTPDKEVPPTRFLLLAVPLGKPFNKTSLYENIPHPFTLCCQ